MTKKLFLIDALSQFRNRYVVEAETEEEAKERYVAEGDSCNLTEFSQLYLGETDLSYREISREEYIKLFDQDNDYLADIEIDRKFELINKDK